MMIGCYLGNGKSGSSDFSYARYSEIIFNAVAFKETRLVVAEKMITEKDFFQN